MTTRQIQTLLDEHKEELKDNFYKKMSDLCLKRFNYESSFFNVSYTYIHHVVDNEDPTTVNMKISCRNKLIFMSPYTRDTTMLLWDEHKDFTKLPKSFTDCFYEEQFLESTGMIIENRININRINMFIC